MLKTCSFCKEEKPIEEFDLDPISDTNEYYWDCRMCRGAWLNQCKIRFDEALYGHINFW